MAEFSRFIWDCKLCNPENLKGGESVIGEDKTRISLYLEKDFVKMIDENIKKYGFSSRSDFFKIAGENLVADRTLQENATAISRKLSFEIKRNGEANSKRISQGFFRYAVQLEMLMRVLAKALGNSDTDIDEIRKDSIRNVYRTKGRVDMEEILRDYNYKKYFQDDYDYKDFISDDEYDY
jgi:Arc/MetJ-type ribon-helix-helix transcriptional regulator